MTPLRTSAAIGDASHVACVRIAGAGAFDTVDRLCPRELFLRDGQILHTLLLRDDARPLADLYVGADDQDFVFLAEGITAAALADHVRAHAAGAVEVRDLAASHALISLDGPYAWEVFAELAGPEVIGQPYMTFFHGDDLTAYRVGKTGEYGYYLQVPHEHADRVRGALVDRGAAFDLGTADLAALDQCALENWFFNIRREGQADATPVELQLQWRVSYKKTYPGSAALAERRTRATHRLVQCASLRELAAGDRVVHGDREIGTIVNVGFSPTRSDWVAAALVERAYAHAQVTAYRANGAPIKTLAAPAINNRSLYVNPQLHSYHTRDEVSFPALVLPSQRCASPTAP